MRVVMLELESDELDEGGPAAQTGSAVHEGVAQFHRMTGDTLANRRKGAWDAIAAAMNKFPLADETEVRLYITPYMNDPRNIDANLVAIEMQVDFTLDPHPLDSTGELIYVQGTLDQVRAHGGLNKVWDLKTGKKTGWELIHDHAIQVAAYTVGARQGLNCPTIEPGGIIAANGYRKRTVDSQSPDGVFYSMPYQGHDIPLILEAVQFVVANIRNGHANFGPGPHCTYCEYKGLAGCLNHYKSLGI